MPRRQQYADRMMLRARTFATLSIVALGLGMAVPSADAQSKRIVIHDGGFESATRFVENFRPGSVFEQWHVSGATVSLSNFSGLAHVGSGFVSLVEANRRNGDGSVAGTICQRVTGLIPGELAVVEVHLGSLYQTSLFRVSFGDISYGLVAVSGSAFGDVHYRTMSIGGLANSDHARLCISATVPTTGAVFPLVDDIKGWAGGCFIGGSPHRIERRGPCGTTSRQ